MNILTIAGSDPSSGAGIQSDIKTFLAFDCHGLTAITAITSQNTSKFSKVEPVSPKTLSNQIDAVCSDFRLNSIKIGMVFNSKIIKTIYKKIRKFKVPIIVDPVIKSTSGGVLLEKKAISDYKKFIIPLATVITPNVFELETLSGIKIKNKKDIPKACKKMKELGAKNIIVTGFEENKIISDYVYLENEEFIISNKKISRINHGSGCNYSAALTAALTKGNNLKESIKIARKFAYDSIKNSKKIGSGIPITQQKKQTKHEEILKKAINNFSNKKNIWKYIPECQTNFVFSKNKPKSTKDILGLEGRIIKAGTRVIVAGDLKFGGSKHVASAVLEMNRKFPDIRSGINIKYEEQIIDRMKRKNLHIQSYNRKNEPKSIKKKENSTISWGIKSAIKNTSEPYDAVYHKGDFGKEPMIIIFGNTPDDVIRKISMIV